MEIFTDVEKLILKETNENYKWIARDKYIIRKEVTVDVQSYIS